MAKYMKMCLTSLIIREMQINQNLNTILPHTYYLDSIATIKKTREKRKEKKTIFNH